MNRVFLTGRVQSQPDTAYTPRGHRIVTFPLWIEDGKFGIDVIFTGVFPADVGHKTGEKVTVAGSLVKAKERAREVLKVRASKIIWMEE